MEKECVIKFEKTYGNSPTLILKKLINKENYKIKELSTYAKLKLKKLTDEAIEESKTTPNFLKGIKMYLDKIKIDSTI